MSLLTRFITIGDAAAPSAYLHVFVNRVGGLRFRGFTTFGTHLHRHIYKAICNAYSVVILLLPRHSDMHSNMQHMSQCLICLIPLVWPAELPAH